MDISISQNEAWLAARPPPPKLTGAQVAVLRAITVRMLQGWPVAAGELEDNGLDSRGRRVYHLLRWALVQELPRRGRETPLITTPNGIIALKAYGRRDTRDKTGAWHESQKSTSPHP